MSGGWQEMRIGDVLRLEYGKPLEEGARSPIGRFPVYGANGSKHRTDSVYHSKPSIIVGRKGSAGELNFAEGGFWPLDVTYFVTFDEKNYDLRFLYYLLTTLRLPRLAKGVKPGINREEVYALPARIPELVEQRRIVGVLDEAFEGIATAKANTEANVQSSRAIFAGHLHSAFSNVRSASPVKQLGEIAEVKDGTHDSPKYVAEGIPFVTQKNIRENGLSLGNTRFISQEDHDNYSRRSNAAYGDILISMISANRGMACLVNDERTFSIKNVGLVKRNSSVDLCYLLYFLKSPQGVEYVQSASKGGAQEFIGLTELRKFPVPVPPMKVQNELAAKFMSLYEMTLCLESIYERKLAALTTLKMSLLHQALIGKL
jgi:type I restriction enzyme S subunit